VTRTLSKLFSWGDNVDYKTSKHLPTIPVLLVAALTIEGLGALCLITGFAARAAVALVFFYLLSALTVSATPPDDPSKPRPRYACRVPASFR
jgi:uncharacterized membrane protein YphA (DoxX/SURF4 family)